jgi:hypothetical protein
LFPRLTLVGQGAGVLLICELLDALASAMPDLLRDELALDIIFLAPAVTHRRFAMIIDAHYRRIAHFRMFALHDPLECRDALVPILYPRSLLYFISGVLEGEATDSGWKADVDAPLLGMERYLTDIGTYPAASFPDLDKARRFLAAFPAGTAFSEVDGGPGRRSRARAHADFDREDASVESLKWLLANGF